jgi:hypothetical protein
MRFVPLGPALYRVVVFLFSALFVLFFYTLLHEGGHALTGLLLGGEIYAFNVNFLNMSAHVGMNGHFSALERALVDISGMALPLLVWTVLLFYLPPKVNPALRFLKTLGSIGLVSSMLPWVVIPVLYMFGKAPDGDDVTHFLKNSGASPWSVFVFSLLLLVGTAMIYIQRLGGISSAAAGVHAPPNDFFSEASRRTVRWMGATLVAGFLVVWAAKSLI